MSDRPDGARETSTGQDLLLTTVACIAIVWSLQWARDVLIPLALAILIAFVLAPLVHLLRPLGLPRSARVIAVVTLAFAIILGVGSLGGSQLTQVAEQLPLYESNISAKIRALKLTAFSGGPLSRAASALEDIGKEVAGDRRAIVAPQGANVPLTQSTPPVPVEVRQSAASPLATATDYLQVAVGPLATTGLVILLVIFLLLDQDAMRDRLIRLLGRRELHRTTEVMQEAARRLSRYLLLQTMVNAAFGVVVAVGLWLIGIPSPLLWGIVAMLARYVPYFGAIIAAIMPLALSAAVDPGWSMLAWTAALFIVTETIVGQMIEPFLYGHQTGLSPIAIVIAATFWTWLWGPIGLVLATPLTLCLAILGQYTQRLEPLSVLLGDEPVLTPPESFYQRLIAGDPAEILDQAETQLKETSLTEYLDEVAVPGLALAQRDVESYELTPERQEMLLRGVHDLVDGLADHAASGKDARTPSRDAKAHAPARGGDVLCVGARGAADQAAAALLTSLLECKGIHASEGVEPGLPAVLAALSDKHPPSLVCLSFVGGARPSQVRFAVRRVQRMLPGARVLIGLWQSSSKGPEGLPLIETTGADAFASSLRQALELCEAHVHGKLAKASAETAAAQASAEDAEAPPEASGQLLTTATPAGGA